MNEKAGIKRKWNIERRKKKEKEKKKEKKKERKTERQKDRKKDRKKKNTVGKYKKPSCCHHRSYHRKLAVNAL